jgi:hypothetical protein
VRDEQEVPVRFSVVVTEPRKVGRFLTKSGRRAQAVMLGVRDVTVYECLRDAVGGVTLRSSPTDLHVGHGAVGWSTQEVADRCGLSVTQARLALKRLASVGLIVRRYDVARFGIDPPLTMVFDDVPAEVGDVYLEVLH